MLTGTVVKLVIVFEEHLYIVWQEKRARLDWNSQGASTLIQGTWEHPLLLTGYFKNMLES